MASAIPGCDHGLAKLQFLVHKPGGQAIVLAESGASSSATVAVLQGQGVDDRAIRQHMSANITDALGGFGPLYRPEEVQEALASPRRIKELADDLVADLLVSAGKHPAGVRYLAMSSNMPSNVVNLVEERLRRRGPMVAAGPDRRADRGLRLIDEWTGRGPVAPASPQPARPAPAPEPPLPPEPAA